MKIATAHLKLLTPYCQSKCHGTPKINKEGHDDYEHRTWREKAHTSERGEVLIPSFAIANCLRDAAKYLSVQVPGKGKSTYTKHFDSGVDVIDDIPTGILKENVLEQRMHVPTDGRRGSGSRAFKSFPLVLPPLEFTAKFIITDDVLTAEVFAYHLQQAGQLIGIGAFRVRNRGRFGKFQVLGIQWEDLATTEQSLPPITIV